MPCKLLQLNHQPDRRQQALVLGASAYNLSAVSARLQLVGLSPSVP